VSSSRGKRAGPCARSRRAPCRAKASRRRARTRSAPRAAFVALAPTATRVPTPNKTTHRRHCFLAAPDDAVVYAAREQGTLGDALAVLTMSEFLSGYGLDEARLSRAVALDNPHTSAAWMMHPHAVLAPEDLAGHQQRARPLERHPRALVRACCSCGRVSLTAQ
jgi:hypothetical protein